MEPPNTLVTASAVSIFLIVRAAGWLRGAFEQRFRRK